MKNSREKTTILASILFPLMFCLILLSSACKEGGKGKDSTPSITAVAPNQGTVTGNYQVSITGKNFVKGGTTVTIGNANAGNVTYVSSSEITATVPAANPGIVTVTVATKHGTARLANGFTYVDDAPVINNINPNRGSPNGATLVTIQGTNFQPGIKVFFGALEATDVQVARGTQIDCKTPAQAAGVVDTKVVNPDGKSHVLAGSFTYKKPMAREVTPASGSQSGFTAVAITGSDFDVAAGAKVFFGATEATNVVVVDAGNITCVTPAGAAAGAVNVRIQNQDAGLSEDTIPNGYTYTNSNKIYWTNSNLNKLETCKIDGSGKANVIASTVPYGIVVHVPAGKIYWTEYTTGVKKVRRCNMDGTTPEDFVAVTGGNPTGITINTAVTPAVVYWCETGATKQIQWKNVDGGGAGTLAARPGDPYYITVDSGVGKMFWTEIKQVAAGPPVVNRASIFKANLDGTSAEEVIGSETPGTPPEGVKGIALDKANGQIYWADHAAASAIYKVNYNGTNILKVMDASAQGLHSVGEKLYWASLTGEKIERANFDGSELEAIITNVITPLDVAIDAVVARKDPFQFRAVAQDREISLDWIQPAGISPIAFRVWRTMYGQQTLLHAVPVSTQRAGTRYVQSDLCDLKASPTYKLEILHPEGFSTFVDPVSVEVANKR